MDDAVTQDIEEFSGIEQPPLLEQIKRILDEYRNDVQIIKELVQNADDAEATVMKILYEGRTINEEHEDESEYRKFLRAPALVFYNDAKFTEDDWRGIRAIYTSVKKEDPLKIGRFGLGFKSVFHLTDYPCIISGEYALFINPHARESGRICVMVKLVNLKKWQRLRYPDYMDTLGGTFGFSEHALDKGTFEGTMFWFPLRQTPSPLSNNIYPEEQVLNLLQAFLTESNRSLIFLKTLCSVQMYVNHHNVEDTPANKMTKTHERNSELGQMNFGKEIACYTVKISNKHEDLVQKRRAFLSELKEIGSNVPSESSHWVFNTTVHTEWKCKSEETKIAKSRWLILNYLKGGEISERMKDLMQDKDLGYPHIVGLAAPVSETNEYSSTSGHVFCYQPLPQESASTTGLPVHLNAFFALSQNRRQIRWPDQDDSSNAQGDPKIEWNISLKSEIFPDAYSKLIDAMINLSQDERNPEHAVKAVYNTIPDLPAVDQHWTELGHEVANLCKEQNIIYTEQDDGKWIRAIQAVYANFHTYPNISQTCQATVFDLLFADKINVVRVPKYVTDALESSGATLVYITPVFLKSHMQHNYSYKKMDLEQKQDLIEFISYAPSDDGLGALELVPLEDGTFVTFSTGKDIFLESQDVTGLFPGMKGNFVCTNLRPRTSELLSALVETGEYCLGRLTDKATVRMIADILTEVFDVNLGRIHVTNPNANQWKPWVRGIWDLIQSRFRNSIEMFSELPLFPLVSGSEWATVSQFSLLPLSAPLFQMSSFSSVCDKELIHQCFELLSISLIEHLPEGLDNGLVSPFLHDDTSESIIALLARIGDEHIELFNCESTDDSSAAFLTFVSERIHTPIGKKAAEKLQKLRLFRGHVSMKESELVSLYHECDIYDGTQFPIRFSKRMIMLNSNSEKTFAKYLEANFISELELVRLTLRKVHEYNSYEIQQFIYWIITNENHFDYFDVQEALSDIAFQECTDGRFYKPNKLFDPTDKMLLDLFRNEHVFPKVDIENDQELLYVMRQRKLGLKTAKDITSKDIDHVCSRVHEMSLDTAEVDTDKCSALLSIMNERPNLVQKDNILKKRCILVEEANWENYPRCLPLKNRLNKSGVLLCMPSEVKSGKYILLIGSITVMIDCKNYQNLSRIFGWEIQPKVLNVVEHLYSVVESYQPKSKSTYLPVITAVYEWLEYQDECTMDEVRAVIQDQFGSPTNNFVWDGNAFQTPQHIYAEQLEGDIDMKPFLHALPTETQHLSDFFIGLGCRKSLDLDMYIDTLHRIKCTADSENRNSSDAALRTLSIGILNKIKQNYVDDLDGREKHLYFPTLQENDFLQMVPAKQCTFCDAQWLKDLDFQLDDNIYYVHPDVPLATAEALGVPSLRQQMMSETEAFEEWGQEEPLTRRLRNLLKEGYVDGFSVAKELFQNADDAGATKLWILFDERENNDAKTQLISDGMAECQGPAIWAFNDAEFTEADFKNITKLSGATKEDDSDKIGKFGLGFCAVYNITDVPSFVSGENIVMFDPHMSYLGKALPGRSPGLRINFRIKRNLKMMKRLKNQFKPYEGVFNCNITESSSPYFNGTLFRLPLRNRASDISDMVYTPTEVNGLFEKIMTMAANMFFFNQNVVDFKLLHIPKSENNPLNANLLFEVCKETTRLMPATIGKLYTPVLMDASSRKKSKSLARSPLRVLDRISIEVRKHTDTRFQIRKEKVESRSDWLVSWATGTNEKTLQLTDVEIGALPLGAVAIPINDRSVISSHTGSLEVVPFKGVSEEFYRTGHLFFFLPLPIKHRFSFHVNSQFTVTTDRRQLRTSSEDDKNVKMKEWNECLLADPVSQSLLYLLEELHTVGRLQGYTYAHLWPRHETDELLDCLPYSFYKRVVQPEAYNVFEKDGHWFDISRCVFIERKFRSSSVGEIAFDVLSTLTEFVVEIPDDIYALLLQADSTLILKKTVSDTQFFLQYFLPNLEQFGNDALMVKRRNLLLVYAVELQDNDVDMWLKSNKCIPSKPHGYLKRPNELIDTVSELATLFGLSDGYFPANQFTARYLQDKLRMIGLMHDVLPDSLVVDRAHTIEDLNKRCSECAIKRSGYLLTYLSEKIVNHEAVISELQLIRFIPVKSKPHDWPFEWHAEMLSNLKTGKKCKLHKSGQSVVSSKRADVLQSATPPTHFDRACNVYYSDCKHIVGCIAFIFEDESYRMCKRVGSILTLKTLLKSIGMNGIQKSDIEVAFVAKQLETIASSYEDTSDNGLLHTISGILQDIYFHLDIACELEASFEYIADELKHKAIVFTSHVFVLPTKAAKQCYSDCKPHLYSLRDSPMKSCKQLHRCLGIADIFQPYSIAIILQNVTDEKNGTPLNESDIAPLIALLTCLQHIVQSNSTSKGRRFELESIIKNGIRAIYGPDEHCILRECATMCFNDEYDETETSESMIYAHGSFPSDLAKYFGVKPKLVHNLEETSDDIEDFYQDEPLVTRLQRLVEGYPCDSGIFKELMQNADDAHATEIHFLKDYTTHPTNNIVDKQFSALQGPALVVYNDSAFSNDDLEGIQKLGRGSKADDPSQTGRYGVGFNAVYNLTDAPSFYTRGGDIEKGETICIFDPLAIYIPNVSRRKPGKRYRNVSLIRRKHSDMMSGYHEERLINGGKGTVFRFPLRTEDMARTSDIKQEAIEMEDISKLLDCFCNELTEAMLFLKHLRTVRVSSYKANGISEDFCVEVKMKVLDEDCRASFVQYQANLCDDFKRKREDVFKFTQRSSIYDMSVVTRRKHKVCTADYIVVQTLGFKESESVPDLVKRAFLNGKIGLLPQGGLALHIKKLKVVQQTYGCAEKLRLDARPTGKAFCFLPLPINTGIPVHVHGYFALDHETRRTLWKSENTDSCYRTLWNLTLIDHVISPSYVCLLDYTKRKLFQSLTNKSIRSSDVDYTLSDYQTLFPLKDNVSDFYWKQLMYDIYRELVKKNIGFLPVQEMKRNTFVCGQNNTKMTILSWTSLNIPGSNFPAYINAESNFNTTNNVASDFNSILRRIGMRIVCVTDDIKSSMRVSDVEIVSLKPEHVINFICLSHTHTFSSTHDCKLEAGKHIVQTALNSIGNAAAILEYCLRNLNIFISNLKQIPLMVTQDNVVRTVPKDSYVFVEETNRFCQLFPTKRHIFLHGNIAHVLQRKFPTYSSCSDGALTSFKLRQFVELVEETSQIEHNNTAQLPWDRKNPEVLWIQTFWEFFSYQLPTYTSDTRCSVIRQQLEMIKYIPLIPAVESSTHDKHLVPACNITSIIGLQSFVNNPVLYSALEKLNLLQLDEDCLNTIQQTRDMGSCEMLLEQIPNIQNPLGVIKCLHLNVDKLANSALSDREALVILTYFNGYLSGNISSNVGDKLKEMPLFVSHFGKRLALKHYGNICVVPKDLPKEGLEDLAEKASVLFLYDCNCEHVFKYLQINKLSVIQVYAQYVIPEQEKFQRASLYMHLEFLSQYIDVKNDENCALLSMLRETRFIDTIDHMRVRACDLFDPDYSVFKRMCKEFELVPPVLRNCDILEMLRMIGLIAKMTMPLFERFARSVQEKGELEALSENVRDESKLLTTELLHMDSQFFDQESFNELAKIHFVTPFIVDKTLTAIKQQFKCHKLICFEGAVLECSQNISWTVASILPSHADPTKEYIRAEKIIEKLKICRKPNFKLCLKHCVNIGRSLEETIGVQTTESHNMLQSVMEDIYQSLQIFHHKEWITEESLLPLQHVTMVYYPEEKMIIAAQRVVLSCQKVEEIPPYFKQSPDKYARYKDVFQLLGAMETPSCDSFASVLRALKGKSGESELIPNENSDAMKAMGHLFKYLAQQTEHTTIRGDHLFLLSANNTLKDATELIVPNNAYYQTQLDKSSSTKCVYLVGFEKFHEYKIRMEDCIGSLKHLSSNHRPHLLTDICMERVILENIQNKEGRHACALGSFINCNGFVYGFLRLVRHVWKSEKRPFSTTDEDQIVKYLNNITFRHCSGIETMLALRCIENGKLGNEILVENTNENKNIHVETNENSACCYFDTADEKWRENVTKHLTIYLNSLVGKCLRDEHFLLLMEIVGMFESPQNIGLFLSKEKIEEYQTAIVLENSPSHPTPGDFVPRKYHKYLDNDYGVIYEYDYKCIAWEVDDPALDMDDGCNEGDNRSHDDDGDTENNTADTDNDVDGSDEGMTATYKYVHIIRKVGPDSVLPLMQQYEIDYGSESTLVVKAYQLFKFVRKGKENTDETRIVIYESNAPIQEKVSGDRQRHAPIKEEVSGDRQRHTPSLREAYNEVRQYLREAWREEENERRQIVKRMYLKWHPDKNPNNLAFCTKVFQYIQQCLDRLERGLDLVEDENETGSGSSGSSPYTHPSRNNWYNRYWSRHHRGKRYNEWRYNNGSYGGFDDYWRFGRTYTETKYEPYHWVSEARRWHKQAECDLRNARAMMIELDHPYFNWVCYSAHQAAEKSLKAAWYAKDANKIDRVRTSHSMEHIALGLGSTLQALALHMTASTGEHTRMMYPSYGQLIPAETYSRQTAETVVKIAQKILIQVQCVYNIA